MIPLRFNRRNLLTGIGGMASPALLAPFVPSAARGATAPPKRILFYFHSMGFLEEYFWPAASQTDAVKPGGFTQNFTLGESLKALEPWKQKMLLVDGINCFGMGASNVTYRICDNAHGKGLKMVFTGGKTLGPNGSKPGNARDAECTNDLATGWQPADGPSLDQVIAARVGRETPFKSLHLSLAAGSGTHRHAFWAGANQPITAEENPLSAFNRLFGNLTTDTALAAKLKVRRQSVIDLVQDELDRLKNRIGASQKIKMDSHLSAVRELELRLTAPVLSCSKPAAPAGVSGGPRVGAPAQAAIRAHMDVIVNAFRCDLTRVGTLQLGNADDGPIPDGQPLERHPAAHSVNDTNPDRVNAINSYRRTDEWYASHLAYLMQKMDAIDEGNGSMLDNTLIVFGTDTQGWLREGGTAHMGTRFPTLFLGGQNHFFKTGRYVKTRIYDIAGGSMGKENLPSHHRVLVAIAQKFGFDIDTFGSLDPALIGNHPGGALPELSL
jgi:Protein of unknown function (DUF1552)